MDHIEAAIEKFEQEYAERSGVTVEWLHVNGRRGAQCHCGDGMCDGFQMTHDEIVSHFSDPVAKKVDNRPGLMNMLVGHGTFDDRLESLEGHEVIVIQTNEPVNEDDTYGLPPGRCREVGDGYMVIETTAEEEGGDVDLPGEFIINTAFIARVIHMLPECSGCLVDSLNGDSHDS